MSEEEDLLIENEFGFSDIEYAGFWIRFGAALIDGLIMLPIGLLSFYNTINFKSIVLLYLLTILSFFYKPLLEWHYGATLGKMACKIKVVSENMKNISIDQAFGRYAPWIISTILSLMSSTYMFLSPDFYQVDSFTKIGEISQESPFNMMSQVYNIIFLVIVGRLIFDKRKQGFHDKIAKTYCIQVK